MADVGSHDAAVDVELDAAGVVDGANPSSPPGSLPFGNRITSR